MNTDTNANPQKTSRDLEKGALWLKKSKAGADFLSGYFLDEEKNKINIVVFKNNFKKQGESSPDYRVYLSENKQQGVPESTVLKVPKPTVLNEPPNEQTDSSDEIPF